MELITDMIVNSTVNNKQLAKHFVLGTLYEN